MEPSRLVALKSSRLFLTLMMPKSTVMQSGQQVVELIISTVIFSSALNQIYWMHGRLLNALPDFSVWSQIITIASFYGAPVCLRDVGVSDTGYFLHRWAQTGPYQQCAGNNVLTTSGGDVPQKAGIAVIATFFFWQKSPCSRLGMLTPDIFKDQVPTPPFPFYCCYLCM